MHRSIVSKDGFYSMMEMKVALPHKLLTILKLLPLLTMLSMFTMF